MSKSKRIVTIVVVLLALVALGGAALALAQESQLPEDVAPEQGEAFGPRQGLMRMSRFLRDRMPDALAEALGISVEELQTAQQEARASVIEQAVEEGLITQAQADLMQGLADLKNWINPEELTAEALGISVEELQEAREEGKTLRDLLAELELDPAEVREAFQAAREEAIQQAVQDGIISQEVADQILSRPRLGFHGPRGHGFRGPGRFRGFNGFGQFQNGNGQLAPASSA